ncbi:MAG: glyoxalase [Lewinellaceae bacterium]|nr:glyoxalase [Lewinellaceae bacterium]
MHIKELTLYTEKIDAEKAFYSKTLGFDLLGNSTDHFSVQIGNTTLRFQKTDIPYRYHYCFLIPANRLQQGIGWLKKRLLVIEIEPGRVIQRFETWNADSVYFYDGTGNITEFIVRYDLQNESPAEFDNRSLLCVNEIGMPTRNVQALNAQLERELHTPFWKGDLERFGTNGSQNGLFLLPNYEIKTEWFPTDLKITAAPFEAVIEQNGRTYRIDYRDEVLRVLS